MSQPFTRISIDEHAVRELDRQPELRDHVFQTAVRAVRLARGYSPNRTGHYLRSLSAKPGGTQSALAYITATDFKAWWIEFGAYHRPHPYVARAPLRKAVARLGLRFVPTSRRG